MTSLIVRAKPEGVTDLSRTISNSEVSAFTQCERKHYYAFLSNLEPNTTGQALSRGIIGHEALAVYYQMLMDGEDPAKAQIAATDVVAGYMSHGFADTTMLVELINLLNRYFAAHPANEWEILAVEKSYEIAVTDDYIFAMRLDLLIRDAQKRVALVDHKFVYDFYNDNILSMNAQMPKYLGTLRVNNIQAEYAILNQLRYRLKKGGNTDEELFKRATLHPNNHEIRTVMAEQFKVSERIMERRKMEPQRASSEAVRTMNQMTCKNCSFISLCKSELMGGDITLMVQQDFKQNAYATAMNPEDET